MAPSAVVRRAVAAASLVGLVLVASPVEAADPSGSPGPSAAKEPGGFPQIQVWQDGPLPPDIPAGQMIEVGFTVWDAEAGTLPRVGGSEVRVHPKTGKAAATKAFTRSDWPGHLVAPITIPKGGLGTIEVGVTGRECHDDTGTCNDVFVPYTWGGIGPPPDAPRAMLVEASIQAPAEPILSGQPFDVVANVTPRADWAAEQLALPQQLVLVAREVRGSSFSMADLNAKGDGGTYTGSMVVPEVGDAVLIVGFPRAGGGDPDLVDASIFRVTVLSGRGAAADSPPPRTTTAPPPPGDSPPVVPIVLVLIGLIAGAVVLTRVLADL